MPQSNYDPQNFANAINHGQLLKAQHTKRNQMLDAMEDMYLMVWEGEDTVKSHRESVAITRSPSIHNKVGGATRLLSTTAPQFSVPAESNEPGTADVASKIEQYCTRLYDSACRVTQEKIDWSVSFSVVLYGEVVIAVDRTEDIVDNLKARKSREKDDWLEAAILRAERTAKKAPYLFSVWDPRTCYPEFDKMGLRALYREVQTTAGAVLDEFGTVEGLSDVNRTDSVTLCHYWDFVWRYIWVLGAGEPIIAERHGLPFIPIAYQLGEGSRSLFADPENWRLPMLYPVWKSNQWENENLFLTVAATQTAAFGSNPMFTANLENPQQELIVDHNVPGGILKIKKGESFGPTAKVVVDQSVLLMLERAKQDIEESTIYSQTLGEPIGANATYSMTALLHQAGRLPLAVPQMMAGNALASAMMIALAWVKQSGKASMAGVYGDVAELAPADIPDNVGVECVLDVALPQDRLGNVNVARMVTDPSNPLASRKWTQSEILMIEQPDQMEQEILQEKLLDGIVAAYLQQQLMAFQQSLQQPPGGQPPPPTQPQGPGPGGQMPPEMLAGGMQGPEAPMGEQQQFPPAPEGGPYGPYGQ